MNSRELGFVSRSRWDTCKYHRSLEPRSLRMVDPSHHTIWHVSSFRDTRRVRLPSHVSSCNSGTHCAICSVIVDSSSRPPPPGAERVPGQRGLGKLPFSRSMHAETFKTGLSLNTISKLSLPCQGKGFKVVDPDSRPPTVAVAVLISWQAHSRAGAGWFGLRISPTPIRHRKSAVLYPPE